MSSDQVPLPQIVDELEKITHALKTGGVTEDVKKLVNGLYFPVLGRAINTLRLTFEEGRFEEGALFEKLGKGFKIRERQRELRDEQRRSHYLGVAKDVLGKAVYDEPPSIGPDEAVERLSDAIEGLKRISYKPAKWFKEKFNTKFGIPAPRLRKARERGTIDAYELEGKIYYSVSDAERLWPEDMHYEQA